MTAINPKAMKCTPDKAFARSVSLVDKSERWFTIADLLDLGLRAMPECAPGVRYWMEEEAEKNPDLFRCPDGKHGWACYWKALPVLSRHDFTTRRVNAMRATVHVFDDPSREDEIWRRMIRPALNNAVINQARRILIEELERYISDGQSPTAAAKRIAADIPALSEAHPLRLAACAANAMRRGLSYRTLLNWRADRESCNFPRNNRHSV